MALKFNYDKLMKDFLQYLKEEIQWALQAWESEVYRHMRNKFAIKQGAEVKAYVIKRKTTLIAFLEANPAALADAYGTGSLMNTKDNPLFEEYRSNVGDGEGQWNPARTGKTIVGRPAGHYIDIFGRPRKTSGVFKGKPMEGMKFRGIKLEPMPPSNSIKIADQFLFNTYLPRAIENAEKRINYDRYLQEVKE